MDNTNIQNTQRDEQLNPQTEWMRYIRLTENYCLLLFSSIYLLCVLGLLLRSPRNPQPWTVEGYGALSGTPPATAEHPHSMHNPPGGVIASCEILHGDSIMWLNVCLIRFRWEPLCTKGQRLRSRKLIRLNPSRLSAPRMENSIGESSSRGWKEGFLNKIKQQCFVYSIDYNSH